MIMDGSSPHHMGKRVNNMFSNIKFFLRDKPHDNQFAPNGINHRAMISKSPEHTLDIYHVEQNLHNQRN